MTSDIILTAARNLEQKAAGVGKMHIAKNRQGRDGQIFAYSIDTAKCKIDMFDISEDEVDEEMKTEAERIRDKLLSISNKKKIKEQENHV
jgi:hypothetical protein